MGTDKLQLKRLAYSLHFIVQFAPFVRSETLSFVTTAVIEIMGARRHGQEGALALPWKMYTVSQKKYTPGCLAITLANVDSSIAGTKMIPPPSNKTPQTPSHLPHPTTMRYSDFLDFSWGPVPKV